MSGQLQASVALPPGRSPERAMKMSNLKYSGPYNFKMHKFILTKVEVNLHSEF
jgi:hypothetical protein